MRYWKALAFCRDHLVENEWRTVALNDLSEHLACTRRNAQLVIKRLVKEQVIEWRSGVGRGNLPSAKILLSPAERIDKQANNLLEEGQIESAISIVEQKRQNQFVSDFLAKYQAAEQTNDVLQVPFYRGTHCLDPVTINRRTEQHIATHLYANLLKVNRKTNEIETDLAHSWRCEGTTLHITLRKGLKFVDGSPLTSEDVVQHFQRLKSSNSSSRALFEFIDEVAVSNDYCLSFISQKLPNLLPKLLAHGAMGITKVVDEKVIGTGPFKLAEQTQWRTLLTINENYHGFRPWVDGVEVWNLGDKAKDLKLNAHVVHGSELNEQQSKHYNALNNWERGCIHAMLNPNRHPWMKAKSNRVLLQRIMGLMGFPNGEQVEEMAYASGMMSTPTLTQPENRALEKPSLQSDCFTSLDSPLKVLTYQLESNIQTAKLIVQTLTQYGVNVELEVLEFPDFNQVERLSVADILVTGEVFDEDIEMSLLGWLLATQSITACLTNRDQRWLADKVTKAMGNEKQDKRNEQLQNVERDLISKALYQPLYHVKQDLQISEKISAPDLLANGWIDFCQVVM